MDLTIVIQPDIIIINILYISVQSSTDESLDAAAEMSTHPCDSIIWHVYGNHEQGGRIKFFSKSKYLATALIQITHCQHFI